MWDTRASITSPGVRRAISVSISASDEDYHREISEEIARHLRKLVNLKRETSVLVVGLGNQAITADALGPHVVEDRKSVV